MNLKSTSKYTPVTFAILIASISLYFIVQWISDFGFVQKETYEMVGAPYAYDIFSGEFWGVITNSLLHIEWWHLLINVLLFLLFTRKIEQQYGSLFFAVFGFMASIVTSTAQLAMTGDPGIGLSGVNVAFIALMIGDEKSYWRYKWITITAWIAAALIVVFAVCNFYFQWYLVGLSSIVSGIVFGFIYGKLLRAPKLLYPYVLFVIATCTLSLFYNPYSSEWNTFKGYKFYEKGDLDTAEIYYKKAVKLSPKNVIATKNLLLIKVDRLSDLAYQAHSNEKYSLARRYYMKILQLDRNNYWARKNIKELP